MTSRRTSLQRRTKLSFRKYGAALRIVDLFAGCGGLTLGVAQAAAANGLRPDVRLAVDFEPLATEVYKNNFRFAGRVETAPVEQFFDGEIGGLHTLTERRTATEAGEVDVLLGGPPCQGHSNLNNHTRRVDGKNALYLRMVRAAEVLKPRAVLIENVPAVLNDRHDGEGVVDRARKHLTQLGYKLADRVVELDKLGVAQTRRRHILLAIRKEDTTTPRRVFDALPQHPRRDLRWAIGDLIDADETNPIDRAPQAQAANKKRMQYLLDNDLYDLPNALRPKCHQGEHSYKSMYGRLRWDEPAQTITSGFGSIGQGRYMHPERLRALTAHEAARIQGFPDYFDFSPCQTRGALATMIGNAVPPALTAAIFGTYLAQTNNAENEADQEAAASG